MTTICHPHKAKEGKQVSVAEVVNRYKPSDGIRRSRMWDVMSDIENGFYTELEVGHILVSIKKFLKQI